MRPAWLESSGFGSRATRESFRMDAVAKTTIIMFCLSQKMMIMGMDKALFLSDCYAGDGDDDTDRGGHN